MNSFNKLIEALKNINNVYIVTHVYPDGDAIGSAFALGRALQKMNKTVAVNIGEKMPPKFKFMNEYVTPTEFKPDYIVSVDLASNALLPPDLEKYSNSIDICIDHHASNNGFAPINYIDANAAATAEIIYDVINKLGVHLDKQIAESLYIGISSDTGCFRYSNTTYKSHEITSNLMKCGVNVSSINEKFFTVKSRKQLKLEKILYENLEFFFNNQCAISFITADEMKKQDILDEECEGIASIPIKVEGVNIGITVREKSENCYKVSVRTNENYNSAKIAGVFDGGGHFKAAGFTINGDLKEIKERILKTVESELS